MGTLPASQYIPTLGLKPLAFIGPITRTCPECGNKLVMYHTTKGKYLICMAEHYNPSASVLKYSYTSGCGYHLKVEVIG